MATRKSTTAAAPASRKSSPAKAAPAKTSAKPAVKTAVAIKKAPAAKPVVDASATKPATATAAPTSAAKTAPDPKAKPKLVRDSFTMPKAEYAVIDALKHRAMKLQRPAKKSELLRAGIKALSTMSDAALLVVLQAVPTIKTGRPNKR
jgi:hypothetical protein